MLTSSHSASVRDLHRFSRDTLELPCFRSMIHYLLFYHHFIDLLLGPCGGSVASRAVISLPVLAPPKNVTFVGASERRIVPRHGKSKAQCTEPFASDVCGLSALISMTIASRRNAQTHLAWAAFEFTAVTSRQLRLTRDNSHHSTFKRLNSRQLKFFCAKLASALNLTFQASFIH